VSLVTEPELVVGRSGGRVAPAPCRALARREATPSENEGTVVWFGSRGETGCTPIITNGTILGSDGEEVESEGVSSSSSVVVDGSISIIVSLFVLCAADEAPAADCSELNRYINKYVNPDPLSVSDDVGSESLLRACANCDRPCLKARKNPSKLPSGAFASCSSIVSLMSPLKSQSCEVLVVFESVETTREAARAAPATYRNRESISA
jgi:hypothetical protein